MVCKRELVYNDDTWATITSPDQDGCNKYLETIIGTLIDAVVLHVGTGTSSIYANYYDIFQRLDGITIMDSEIQVADEMREKLKCPYHIYRFDKYDVSNFTNFENYQVIVDNNLKQHACCNEHWFEYFNCIVGKLAIGGILLTHTQGFSPHTNNVDFLTVDELVDLCSIHQFKFNIERIESLKNSENHYPLVIRRTN